MCLIEAPPNNSARSLAGHAQPHPEEGPELCHTFVNSNVPCVATLQPPGTAALRYLKARRWHYGVKCATLPFVKKALLLIIILATGWFTPACHKSDENAGGSVQPKMEFNYPYDKREVFIDDASTDLKELDQKINEMSEAVTNASTAIKTAAQPKIENLRQQRLTLGQKLEALKSSNEADWSKLTGDYQKAASQMKVSLQESLKWVQDNAGK